MQQKTIGRQKILINKLEHLRHKVAELEVDKEPLKKALVFLSVTFLTFYNCLLFQQIVDYGCIVQ